MASTYERDIQKLYVAYFGRPADVAGLQYWEAVAESGKGGTAAVATAFGQAAEYQATYGGLDNVHAVSAIYQNLFGRSPDIDGLNFWAKGLGDGSFTFGQAVTAIGAGAQGADLVALTDKVIAANVFTTRLDTPAEVAAYTGAQANQVGRVFLAQVVDDVSLLHAFDLDGLKTIFGTSIAAPVAAGGAEHAVIVGTPAVQPGHLV